MIGEYENGDTFYFPVVEFPLPDGTRQTVQMDEGSSTMDYEPGQSVTVRYLPDQPEEARIEFLFQHGPALAGADPDRPGRRGLLRHDRLRLEGVPPGKTRKIAPRWGVR